MKVWKQFRDYIYEASSEGEIRNTLTGRILKQRQETCGYLLVDLKIKSDKSKNSNGTINKTFRVHRIIAEVFFGSRIYGFEVDHINKVRNDNRCENLRWVDKTQNAADRILCGIRKEEVEKIINLYKEGKSIDKIYLEINNKII